MKFSLLFLLGFACMVNAYMTKYDTTTIQNDKDFYMKQKFIVEILRHVYQPLQFTEYLVLGKTFVVEETYYTNYSKVLDFINIYKTKLLPRDEVFSIMNNRHALEIRGLFNLFYYSKDWITFQKNVVFARMHVNQEMFVHALMAAVIHRDDMVGVMLPSLYEILPYKFFKGDIMTYAANVHLEKRYTSDYSYVIYHNYTDYFDYAMNEDSKLSYFTDDVGLNMYYYFFQMDYGFWFSDTDFEIHRRGEKYLWVHQQLLARYYLERLSNGLGEIYTFEWESPIVTGYFPNLRYFNGLNFPMRHNNYMVRTLTKRDYLINDVLDYERRIRDYIDTGLVTIDGKQYNFRDYKTIDILGRIINKELDDNDHKFIGYLEIYTRILLGGSVPRLDDYKLVPSVLEHYETSLRDPMFYQLFKKIIGYYWRFMDYLKIYTTDELIYKGITINNVVVSKLVTYFDYFDVDITNGVDFPITTKMDYITKTKMGDDFLMTKHVNKYGKDFLINKHSGKAGYLNRMGVNKMLVKDHNLNDYDVKDYDVKDYDVKDYDIKGFNKNIDIHKMDNYDDTTMHLDKTRDFNINYKSDYNTDFWKYVIKVRQHRLNHMPLDLGLDITSDKATKVVVRMFIGPKYDEFGRLIQLQDIRYNMVELDRFVYDLKVGQNIIKRNSKEFLYFINDGTTYLNLYKFVMGGVGDLTKTFSTINDYYWGFPDRLLLPKGTLGGLPMRLFFIITPYTGVTDKVMNMKYMHPTGVMKYLDDLPLGYPFDRQINFNFDTWTLPNMFWKDVVIYHRGDTMHMDYYV